MGILLFGLDNVTHLWLNDLTQGHPHARRASFRLFMPVVHQAPFLQVQPETVKSVQNQSAHDGGAYPSRCYRPVHHILAGTDWRAASTYCDSRLGIDYLPEV
jgi:hypothetical protein